MINAFPFRIRFSKTEKLRFLSHHELMRCWERTLRRSELPLKFTEGFNPHIRLSFPTALGMGIESLDEVMEIELASWVSPKSIQQQLQAQLPEGLAITSVTPFRKGEHAAIEHVDYEATVSGLANGTVENKIQEFLARETAPIERRSDKTVKTIDVRRYVMELKQEGEAIRMRIRITDRGTAKPEEVLQALGVEMTPGLLIRKTRTELRLRK